MTIQPQKRKVYMRGWGRDKREISREEAAQLIRHYRRGGHGKSVNYACLGLITLEQTYCDSETIFLREDWINRYGILRQIEIT